MIAGGLPGRTDAPPGEGPCYDGAVISPELTEADFVPLAACAFQPWGERDGPPFSDIRPLGEVAAERLWSQVSPLAASLASRAAEDAHVLDLSESDDWDASSVSRWLLSRASDPSEPVLVCYQPRVVVSVPWDVVCDHWLVFFWTGACVYAPGGRWALVHDGDRFTFGPTAVAPRIQVTR